MRRMILIVVIYHFLDIRCPSILITRYIVQLVYPHISYINITAARASTLSYIARRLLNTIPNLISTRPRQITIANTLTLVELSHGHQP